MRFSQHDRITLHALLSLISENIQQHNAESAARLADMLAKALQTKARGAQIDTPAITEGVNDATTV